MLIRATALTAALQEGRYPRRDQLRAWSPDPDGLQLAFASLVVPEDSGHPTHELMQRLGAHAEGLRRAIDCLDGGRSADAARQEHLEQIVSAAGGSGVIAFTQFEETARGLFRRLRTQPGVVLLSARGGETATGRISRDDIVALAHPGRATRADPRLPLYLLLSTDLLSEGVNLGGLQHVVHVDLPWTPARAHQRLGRLRRPESPHACLHVSAFELPVAAERLVGVLRRLQAKARTSERLIGVGDMLAGAPWAGDGSGGAGGTAHLDLDTALRVRLRQWRARRPDAGVPASMNSGGTLVAVVQSNEIAEWRVLVLAYIEGIPRLLVLAGCHAHDSAPVVVLNLSEFEGEDSAGDDALMDARRCVAAWLSTQRAASMARPVEHAAAGAHARALRALAHFEGALPRSERLRAADRIARARVSLSAQRGAGAERALARLIPRLELETGARPFHDALRELEEVSDVQGRIDARMESEPRFVCAVVAIPAAR